MLHVMYHKYELNLAIKFRKTFLAFKLENGVQTARIQNSKNTWETKNMTYI